MRPGRWFGAVVAVAGVLASLAAPAAAQQVPADGRDGSVSGSVAGPGAPVLAEGFAFGGRWLGWCRWTGTMWPAPPTMS